MDKKTIYTKFRFVFQLDTSKDPQKSIDFR